MSHPSYRELGLAINDVLNLIKPSPKDREDRENLIKQLGVFISKVTSSSEAKIEPYGSFVYNLYLRTADLDVSIDVPSYFSSDELIHDLWKAFHKNDISILNFLPRARIPVITFVSKLYNITCDITINNHMAQVKSKFLLWVSQIDQRFCDLILLVKLWARAYGINNSKDGTFNSYALCLLVVFHLQTCATPILPPLKEILSGAGRDGGSEMQRSCDANIRRFMSVRGVNTCTLSELFYSFVAKFRSIKDMAPTHILCTSTGKWENRRSYRWWRSAPLMIRDPLDQSDNAARTVRENCGLTRIAEAFEETYTRLGNVDPRHGAYRDCLLNQ